MSWSGTISFNSISLECSLDSVPRELSADISVRHIPGGTTDYVDIGGANQVPMVTLPLFFPTAAAYLSFEAQVGVTAQLVYFDSGDGGYSYYTAVLETLRRKKRNVAANAATHADAVFRLLSAT